MKLVLSCKVLQVITKYSTAYNRQLVANFKESYIVVTNLNIGHKMSWVLITVQAPV